MAKPTPWKDEYTLLCEKCGYVVEGLDTAGPCPECGKPIAESLPERRIGTPWQQKPGFKSLMRTWWMTWRHPKQTLDILSPTGSRGLTTITTGIASLIASSGWILPMFLPTKNPSIHNLPDFSILMLIFTIFAFAHISFSLFYISTFIETRGLRFFGYSKNYRVTPEIGKAITAHGSVGWLLCAIGLGIAQLLGFALVYMMTSDPIWVDFGYSGTNLPQMYSPPPAQWVLNARWISYILIIPGFLYFEYFAHLGLRRCKYANRMRPQESLPNEPRP